MAPMTDASGHLIDGDGYCAVHRSFRCGLKEVGP
jgi:hypothetical protein